ncbi:hypothetical protein DFP93_12019 [Aneurinibacillus soli]|uniref:Uncharacterized protein n=1 Tax=Aneurinibacillus soli TaxID=1500254 RepID=A0A0U4WAY6_9BACL|nr:hypothetical protein DFP93_12019 [Aneurinibacillus soli]BAU26056.1 hypothetical protein CB4_00128 [Aneurinibacillus soli]
MGLVQCKKGFQFSGKPLKYKEEEGAAMSCLFCVYIQKQLYWVMKSARKAFNLPSY